jgi:hypothetical protein
MERNMNRLRCLKTIALAVAAVAVFGCKSKHEAPAGAAAPQQGQAVKSISGQSAAGTVTSSPQDKADAEAAATRVIGQMESGDFAGIYKESAPSFKAIGPEAAFVQKFQQTRQKTGPLKAAKEASFVTQPDQSYVLVYHMDNDRFNTERRLTFVRSKAGKMELLGLNQHDEPKNLQVK